MKERLWAVAVFFLALVLRIIYLRNLPAGFTADEAAQGYSAYSILKTGSDEWGVRFPLNPRSVGDFKPPLLTYLIIPSLAIFGLNEFAVRIPNAVLGSLAVVVVYFLTKELFSRESKRIFVRMNANSVALVSSFLLAVSPWHISMSRAAFEMNLTTLFLPLAVFLFLRGLQTPSLMVLSSIVFGLNLFTYHSAKIVTPILLIYLVVWKRKEILAMAKRNGKIYLLISFAIFLILGLIMVDGFFKGAGTRASDIGIFSGKYEQLADNKHFACNQGLPVAIARVFYNKLQYSGEEFLKNYFSYISPFFLFAQGAGEATYGMMPGKGLLYLIEFIFLIISFYLFLKERNPSLALLWFWVIVSPIPASLVRGVGYHASRVTTMMPAIQVISAYGFVRLSSMAGKKVNKIIFLMGVAVLWFSAVFFLEKYFFLGPLQNAPKMNYGWREAVKIIKNSQVDRVVVSRTFSEPQSYIMFFLFEDPKVVQSQTRPWLKYKDEGKNFVDQIGTYTLSSFTFRNFSFPEDWMKEKTLLVGTESDFIVAKEDIRTLKLPRTITDEKGKKIEIDPVIKEERNIYYPSGEVAFKIIRL